MLIGGVNVVMNAIILHKGLPEIERWCKSHHILRHGYHGGGYDGNNSRRILDFLDLMRKAYMIQLEIQLLKLQ